MTYRSPELRWNRVADKAAYDAEVDRLARRNELIRPGKALEDCGLAQGYRAILIRVAEASVAESVAERRNCGRRLIPLHTTVDAGIRSSTGGLVAVGYQLSRPVPPRATGLRLSNSLQVLARKRCGRMKAILSGSLSSA